MLRCIKLRIHDTLPSFTFYCEECRKVMSGMEALRHLTDEHKLRPYESVVAYKRARFYAQEVV